jgi:hypothetical protein
VIVERQEHIDFEVAILAAFFIANCRFGVSLIDFLPINSLTNGQVSAAKFW